MWRRQAGQDDVCTGPVRRNGFDGSSRLGLTEAHFAFQEIHLAIENFF
jgi:hypothetical protein